LWRDIGMLGQQLLQALDKIRTLEMPGRDVHADRPAVPSLLPLTHLRQHLIHHPFADIHDQVGLLDQRQEILGRHQPAHRMLPAQQRFKPHHLAVAQVDLGVEVQAQLPRRQSLANLLDLSGGWP
jgi:hypothetical protein